ncbi:restriction endonuclease subunit S [Sunxiuqinia rutila]|uniref:restriction endonuclease subunit S n=1 Tax=Sunxiuqinia rutila TaxID=1397841 RepID=UPI003D35A146
MKENKNIPELRFPEFEGKWDRMKLKNVSTYFNGGSFENDVQEEGKYELVTLKSVDMNGNLVHSKRYIDVEVPTLSKDTLVMILSEQAPGLLGMTSLIPIDNKYVLNQRVAEIRPTDKVKSYFLSMAINRNQRYFSKHGAGTKVQNISKPNVENYEFYCPSLPEQTKIANFLTTVDERINLLTQQKEKLEQYKKGLMQQIFSQQLRFKDDNGKAFPEWEEKRLTMICEKRASNISANSLKENKGPYKIYGATGFLQNVDFYREGQPYISIVKDGAGVGRVLLCEQKSSVLGTLDIIKPKDENSLDFLFSVLTRISFTKYVTGSTIPHIYFKDYSKEKVNVPCFAEQQKIADFLSSIDQKIELVRSQIEQTKHWKKGLLQQMFV